MANLLERLKPELKAQLEINQALYPNYTEIVKEELTKQSWVNYIPYFLVIDLERIFSSAHGRKPDHLWECFEEAEKIN